MLPSRRHMMKLAASAALFPVVATSVGAQSYPSKPVRWVVPFPPGGAPDIIARLVGQRLSERMGQPFVIENRSGASGNIGTESVVRASPDGNTLLLIGTFNVLNAAVMINPSFDFARDIAPVAGLVRTYYVVVVHPSLPVASIPDLIAYTKQNPSKINMASGGNGSPHQAAGELFKMMTGTDMTHIPYRGAAQAVGDLVAGHVQIMFDNLTSSLQHIRDRKLRPLAVTSFTRSPLFPDLPTVGEFVSGYEASGWLGVGAPKETPHPIVERLNAEVLLALTDPAFASRLADVGGIAMPFSPDDLARLIEVETRKWAKVVAFAGIKPD